MTESTRVALGRINRLQVVKDSAYGLFLDGYEQGEILLPKRYRPENCQPGDWLEVFIYADSEDRLIATTDTPKAMVGEVASLRVAAVNDVGTFLDWGLPKDILVPFSEQAERMQEGFSYCVYLYVDRHRDLIVASSKLSKFLPEHSSQHKAGQAVELLVCGKSDLGFKCLVDRSFLALLHHGDVFQPLDPGRTLDGYIKHVRDDGRVDLCLSPPGAATGGGLEEQILQYVKDQGGSAAIGDKSPPDEIYKLFHTSKKNFKRALSKLYKHKKITIGGDGIRLAEH
ncbi:MAG: S1-like domain-containing RNA-binding protein [Halioglobus sp.]